MQTSSQHAHWQASELGLPTLQTAGLTTPATQSPDRSASTALFQPASKKPAWTAEEDNILVWYVENNGPRRFNTLKERGLLERDGKSCRQRWTSWLRPDRPNQRKCRGRIDFTVEEEELLLGLQASMGNKWAQIAKYFPRHTPHEIKNLWHGRMKKKYQESRPEQFAGSPSSDELPPLASTEPSACTWTSTNLQQLGLTDALHEDLKPYQSRKESPATLMGPGVKLHTGGPTDSDELNTAIHSAEGYGRSPLGQSLLNHSQPGPHLERQSLNSQDLVISVQSTPPLSASLHSPVSTPGLVPMETDKEAPRDSRWGLGPNHGQSPRGEATLLLDGMLPLPTALQTSKALSAMPCPLGLSAESDGGQAVEQVQKYMFEDHELLQLVSQIKQQLSDITPTSTRLASSQPSPPAAHGPSMQIMQMDHEAPLESRPGFASNQPMEESASQLTYNGSVRRSSVHSSENTSASQSTLGILCEAAVATGSFFSDHVSSLGPSGELPWSGALMAKEGTWAHLENKQTERSNHKRRTTSTCTDDSEDVSGHGFIASSTARAEPAATQSLPLLRWPQDCPSDASPAALLLSTPQSFQLQAALNILDGAPPRAATQSLPPSSSSQPRPSTPSAPSFPSSSLGPLPLQPRFMETLIDNTMKLQSQMLGIELHPSSLLEDLKNRLNTPFSGGQPVRQQGPDPLLGEVTRAHWSSESSRAASQLSVSTSCSGGSTEVADGTAKWMNLTHCTDLQRNILRQESHRSTPSLSPTSSNHLRMTSLLAAHLSMLQSPLEECAAPTPGSGGCADLHEPFRPLSEGQDVPLCPLEPSPDGPYVGFHSPQGEPNREVLAHAGSTMDSAWTDYILNLWMGGNPLLFEQGGTFSETGTDALGSRDLSNS